MKKIIIMGASSGIGRALAEAFASRGVKIGVAARRAEALKELEAKYPGMIVSAGIDITHSDAPARLERLIAKLGGMDIYIHVAGIAKRNPELEPRIEAEVAQTDAVGLARMCSAAYCYMRDNKIKGQIAAITSVAGTRGIGELTAYSASKAFGQTYLEALQQRSHEDKTEIAITDIRPGWIKTPLVDPDKQYMLEMELSKVIPDMLRAIARRRPVAVIDWRWALVCDGWRLIPRCIWVRMSGFGL